MKLLTKREVEVARMCRLKIQLAHLELLKKHYNHNNYYVGYLVLRMLNHPDKHTLAQVKRNTPQDFPLNERTKLTEQERQEVWLNHLLSLKQEKHLILEKNMDKIAREIESVTRNPKLRTLITGLELSSNNKQEIEVVLWFDENFQRKWIPSQEHEFVVRLYTECCLASSTFEEELLARLNKKSGALK